MNHSTAYNPITDLTGILTRAPVGYRIVVLDGERIIEKHTCPDLESGQKMLKQLLEPKNMKRLITKL